MRRNGSFRRNTSAVRPMKMHHRIIIAKLACTHLITSRTSRSLLAVRLVCFSPDGKYIARVGDDNDYKVCVWDWEAEAMVSKRMAFAPSFLLMRRYFLAGCIRKKWEHQCINTSICKRVYSRLTLRRPPRLQGLLVHFLILFFSSRCTPSRGTTRIQKNS